MHFALLTWSRADLSFDVAAVRPHPSVAVSTHARLMQVLRKVNVPMLIAWLATLAGVCWPVSSRAAGGHHAVDDASILDAGQCQVELWAEQGSRHVLQHVGPACRVADVELGLNLERSAMGTGASTGSAGAQIKWAADVQPGLAVGMVWAAGWQGATARFTGQTLLLPVSWSPREGLDLHVNVGREWRPHAADGEHRADVERLGAALEWKATLHGQALVEWWRDSGGPQARVGWRYAIRDGLSVDASRAESLRHSRSGWWTVGLNWVFAR
ncbi:hypothetical protein [Roseateles depolymerans]|uniref:Uncharacterized protein n=1 Tax=Roseateles depolymerans TaxID=76731 RepID=A0A0U3CFQ6_9BURK|nr:hypothetical protein [Roseateles depolymerans]ALV07512.1 hypothetical protein RD2015_3051 [Roseateles depolymerans]REG22272.1 hypothetical protein DES44_1416 [Roseateles depolymerans]